MKNNKIKIETNFQYMSLIYNHKVIAGMDSAYHDPRIDVEYYKKFKSKYNGDYDVYYFNENCKRKAEIENKVAMKWLQINNIIRTERGLIGKVIKIEHKVMAVDYGGLRENIEIDFSKQLVLLARC